MNNSQCSGKIFNARIEEEEGWFFLEFPLLAKMFDCPYLRHLFILDFPVSVMYRN